MDSPSSTGTVRFGSPRAFNGVKVFSATMMADRTSLGDEVTAWIEAHKNFDIVEITVTQSSDSSFHCLAMTVFYNEPI
jgi:hypothetical protein